MSYLMIRISQVGTYWTQRGMYSFRLRTWYRLYFSKCLCSFFGQPQCIFFCSHNVEINRDPKNNLEYTIIILCLLDLTLPTLCCLICADYWSQLFIVKACYNCKYIQRCWSVAAGNGHRNLYPSNHPCSNTSRWGEKIPQYFKVYEASTRDEPRSVASGFVWTIYK